MPLFPASEIPQGTADTRRKTHRPMHGGSELKASGNYIKPKSSCIAITVDEYLLHVSNGFKLSKLFW